MNLNNLLIVGETGSGRFNFINRYLSDLMNFYSQQDLRIILANAKATLFTNYSNSAHLMFNIISNENDFKKALDWACREVEKRLAENVAVPAVVIVIDEIADFILADKDYFEKVVEAITKYSSKTNIYLVISTARVNNEILGEKILNNFSQRVVFKLSGAEQFALVLGEAEAAQFSLPGQCIFKNITTGKKEFLKVPYISEEEIAFHDIKKA